MVKFTITGTSDSDTVAVNFEDGEERTYVEMTKKELSDYMRGEEDVLGVDQSPKD